MLNHSYRNYLTDESSSEHLRLMEMFNIVNHVNFRDDLTEKDEKHKQRFSKRVINKKSYVFGNGKNTPSKAQPTTAEKKARKRKNR